MTELQSPWLGLCVLIPLVGAIWVSRLRNHDRARTHCSVICSLTLFATIGAWIDFAYFEGSGTFAHETVFSGGLGSSVFAIDPRSAPLLPLGALLYLATVMTMLRTMVSRFSFVWMLLSEAILMATLACSHPWSIIALLAVAVIPPYVELRKRNQNTRVFALHMGLFISLLCCGQWFVADNASPTNPSILGGCLLTAAALIRSGICPLHCWMTDLFEKSSFGTALLFVTPMTGAYAVVRLVLPIASPWALQCIVFLSLITAVYAAAMALVQSDARRFFGYLFLSQSSRVLIGLAMGEPLGLTGALCVWLSIGISLLGFGLALRSVEARTGRLTLDSFHGLYEHTPFLASMFLLTGLASIGFPGTIGFIGNELLVAGAVKAYPVIGLVIVVAAALNGIAVVKAYFYVFKGTRHTASVSLGCRPVERITVLIIVLLIIGGGIAPQIGVLSRYHAASAFLEHDVVVEPPATDK